MNYFHGGNDLHDIPLHVIHLNQDDPKKCTSRKSARYGDCILHNDIKKSPKRGILLDPLSGILIGVGFLLVLISFGARRKRESGAKKTEKKPTT